MCICIYIYMFLSICLSLRCHSPKMDCMPSCWAPGQQPGFLSCDTETSHLAGSKLATILFTSDPMFEL